MFFPESLYLRLGLRNLDPLVRRVTDSQLATVVNVSFRVPSDRWLFLQNAHMHTDPGAGIQVTNLSIHLVNTALQGFRLIQNQSTFTADFAAQLNWQGSVIVPPDYLVQASGSFSAAGSANLVDLDIVGVLVPDRLAPASNL